MDRSAYKIFAEGIIAGLTVTNRLVRSATWDPSILGSRQMTGDVLNLYRNLALGGVGLIITGASLIYPIAGGQVSASVYRNVFRATRAFTL